MNISDFEMIQAMKRYGGSFVVALAECFVHADSNNAQKLREAFPEYVKKYCNMANEEKDLPGGTK